MIPVFIGFLMIAGLASLKAPDPRTVEPTPQPKVEEKCYIKGTNTFECRLEYKRKR